MRKLNIAYGNSRQAKTWVNKSITFDALKERLKTTIRTTESTAEYAKMKKAQRDEAKDHGGFVAGTLEGGRRTVDKVASRSMVSLDGDHINADFLETFDTICPYTSVLYSTHSSTPEKPRVRLVFPMTRDVTPEEYVAVSRYVADMLGIDSFDECSYLPNQLMYWPSTPLDGQFIYKETDGGWLNPDDILTQHPEWNDPTRLPTSSRESKANTIARKRVEDPLTKEGVVGLFNRTYYPITTAIETFLSDVYESTGYDNRWHLIASSSIAGVEIKEDKFVYSHHAKDPAYLKLLNAFDLVRIHKFGDMDDKESYKAMCEFAMQQDDVKLLAIDERIADTNSEFTAVGSGDSSPSPDTNSVNSINDDDTLDTDSPDSTNDETSNSATAKKDDWKKKLRYQPRSSILENSVFNLNLILNNDPDFANFAFNELANRVQVIGSMPWERPEENVFWRDADMAQLKSLIDSRYVPFSERNYEISFTKTADDRHFHPIRDYLDSLPEWDGEKRVEGLFIRYLEADDTEYIRTVTRKTFAAAVARAYHPGIKFDCVPVLDGEQGIGKSSIVKDLIGSTYYSETLSLTDMDDKSGAEKLQGFWVVEIGELAGMKKADVEKVKAFLSTSDDKYRPSYGRTVESHPRQCIIIATVNGERGYLRDITGNRRFWIIKLHQIKQVKTWNFTDEYRRQFWAEAKAIWKSGEKLYLEGDVLKEAENQQRGAMETDERVGMIEEYLEKNSQITGMKWISTRDVIILMETSLESLRERLTSFIEPK